MAENAEDFVRLLTRHQRKIWWFINTLLPAASDADDVLQETSLVLLRKWEDFDRDRDFLPWACGIARLQVFRFVRKHRSSHLFINEMVLEQVADVAEKNLRNSTRVETRLDALRNCIDELPKEDRELIESRYWTAQTTNQISDAIGRPLVTVYKKLAKTRVQLLNCVTQKITSLEGLS